MIRLIKIIFCSHIWVRNNHYKMPYKIGKGYPWICKKCGKSMLSIYDDVSPQPNG